MAVITIKPYQYLKDLFDDNEIQKITVPSYQRAYSWEEKQLEQFIGDLIEMTNKDKKGYYFGHFIFEKSHDIFQVIDGQQRITTFILFLIACARKTNSNKFKNFIDKFSTVDYDDKLFSLIKNNETIENEVSQKTLSISRIEFALEYFEKQFDTKKLKLDSIEKYIEVLLDSHISTHITDDKAVAVQIFELHNSRGVKLNTIEKVKAKLMKAIYLNASKHHVDYMIKNIQDTFGRIYHLEESIDSNSFRGNIMLDDILLIHLRMIEDGSKLNADGNNKHMFHDPTWQGNKEEIILGYLDKKVGQANSVKYILKLVELFEKSVEFISVKVPKIDKMNHLFGDVLILERNLSLSLFMLLHHLELENKLIKDENNIWSLENNFIFKWEKLLFIRDFHDKYFGLKYKDDFEDLYFRIISKEESVNSTLDYFLDNSFRPSVIKQDLKLVAVNFIKANENNILNNAFHWFKNKMIYILYKFEISKDKNSIHELREIMKNGVSVEHILPQEWQWEWMQIDQKNVTQEAHQFNNGISKIINGIGNLLLLSPSENSSQSNSHPKDKIYSIESYSYNLHKKNSIHWQNHLNWDDLIVKRGEIIYNYLVEFIEN
jgi:hypothetical protein